MFKQHVKEVLREADPNKSLIYHGCLEKVELLALVKKKKNLIFPAKYKVLSTTLDELFSTLSAEDTEEDFVKDYKSSGQISVSASVQGGFDMVSAAAKAEGCSQQESSTVTIKMKAVDLVSLKKGYRDQKIDTFKMPNVEKGEVLGFVDRIVYNADEVKLHGQTEVDGLSKASWAGFFGLSAKGRTEKETSYTVPAGRVYAYGFNEITFQDNEIKYTNRNLLVDIEWYRRYYEETRWRTREHGTFEDDNSTENTYENVIEEQNGTTPEHGTFDDDNSTENTYENLIEEQNAAGTTLEPETFEDKSTGDTYTYLIEELKCLCPVFGYSKGICKIHGIILAPETFEPDNATENTYENLQQIQDELQNIEGVLQPLSHLPRATRSTLFQRLCQVSEEKDAVAALKEALGLWYEQQRFHLPQSTSACSTLDLLRLASILLTRLTDMDHLLRAVYMLVSAMDQLPDHIPAMIAKCSPDTLRALNHLVSSIRDRGEAQVTQPLPGPLQEGGELHWLTEFLCSTDETLQDLELTLVAGETPGMLLLALCITVRGLHMMQGEQNES